MTTTKIGCWLKAFIAKKFKSGAPHNFSFKVGKDTLGVQFPQSTINYSILD